MTIVTPKFGMGASVLRVEDEAFITGKGRYTDDISPAGTLHGYVLRSPVAKAKFSDRFGRGGKVRARRSSCPDRRRYRPSPRAEVRCHAASA